MKYYIILALLTGIIYFIYTSIRNKINNAMKNMFGQMSDMQNPNDKSGKGNSKVKSDEILYKQGDKVILKGEAKNKGKGKDKSSKHKKTD